MIKMLRKLPKVRKYHYTPHFHKPEASTEAGTRPRIQFRKAYYSRKSKRSYLALILLLFITLFIIQYIGRFQLKSPDSIRLNQPEILK